MRIAHYAPRIWDQGGIATYVRRLGDAQTQRDHEVIYLGRVDASDAPSAVRYHRVSDDRDLFRTARSLSLDILHLHKGVHVLPSDRVPTLRTMHGHQGGCPSGTRYLTRREEACDRAYSLPGCLWGHVIDRCGSIRPRQLVSNFARIRNEIELASSIPTLTVSHFIREQMLRAGCPPDHLYTLPSPAPSVDIPFSPVPDTGPPHFLFLGRLVEKKGLAWLLRSFANVDVPAHLDVAGAGPQRAEAEQLVETLGIKDRVTFHGWLETDAVTTLFQRARGVVFPSVWHEPAGLVSLEAAAHGRALIASDVGGIPEYAQDDHAVLVSPHDVEALTGALTQLAERPDRANQMGRHGYQRARSQFSMSRFLDALHSHYERIYTPGAVPSSQASSSA